ncbi:MAG: hypothetical protein SFX73_31910 [Kofleriaceae bacterium]|nr:hypothetical protein [Kofleriaceae bacterium]
MTPRRLPLAVAVFCVLAGVFLLVTGRERPYGDARIVYEVAESLEKGSIAIKTEWPPMSHKGKDGKVYSQYALLPSLAHLPGRLIYSTLWNKREEGTPAAKLALVLTSHVAPAFAAALTCALFFALVARLARRRSALIVTGYVAFGSLVFVYARYPMSEALQAACVMGLVYELARIVRGEHDLRRGIALGVWAGAVVNAKSVLLLGVVGGMIATAILVRERAALKRLAIGALAGGLPWLVLLLVYNHARWGSPFDTGYGETLGMMRESIPTGLLGLLVSPGKGLLWFSPVIVLSAIGLAHGWRDHRALVLVVLAVVLPPLMFYGRFLSWSGDYCWGPRYLVFAIAPLSILLAPWRETVAGRWKHWLVRLVVAASVAVQLLGASLFWDHWIRLSREARLEWLGNPNRAGAAIAEAGRGHCDSCFEDMFGHQWLPPLSPIAGHQWLLGHLLTGDRWDDAQRDAPWRRYTQLELRRPRSIYEAVRVDWWALDASEKSAQVAIVYIVFAGALVAAGVVLLRRRKGDS